jgi:hypothetical protein
VAEFLLAELAVPYAFLTKASVTAVAVLTEVTALFKKKFRQI